MSKNGRIHVEFRRSSLTAVILDASFVSMARKFEGFDQWIYSTRASMSADLREEMETLFHPFADAVLTQLSLAAPDSAETISGVIQWISELDDRAIMEQHINTCRELAAYIEYDGQDLSDEFILNASAVKQFLQMLEAAGIISVPNIDRLVRFLMHPESFKAETIYMLTRFWDRHLEPEHNACRAMEERSIKRYKKELFSGSPEQIFKEVCGRDYPTEHGPATDHVKHMIFVPSCHCGPYISINDIRQDGTTLAIVYNCRPSAGGKRPSVIPIDQLFRPLKGLADETRLEIMSMLSDGELYAQQIVDQMEISQSAVSRHLRLMVACGILQERKQQGMKFYAINTDKIADVIAHLEVLRHQSSS